jgi:hypothetical protein
LQRKLILEPHFAATSGGRVLTCTAVEHGTSSTSCDHSAGGAGRADRHVVASMVADCGSNSTNITTSTNKPKNTTTTATSNSPARIRRPIRTVQAAALLQNLEKVNHVWRSKEAIARPAVMRRQPVRDHVLDRQRELVEELVVFILRRRLVRLAQSCLHSLHPVL